jgi:uncharacterized protein involved in tolerance to divalent cations
VLILTKTSFVYFIWLFKKIREITSLELPEIIMCSVKRTRREEVVELPFSNYKHLSIQLNIKI